MTHAAGYHPAFLITIDVEGDNLWAKPRVITTRNAEFLPRFQALCEACGLRPTYLVDYDMAHAPAFQQFARDVVRRRVAEIGMHLHAWNTPPIVPLTKDDFRFQPYLMEYPRKLIEDKVAMMTETLEDQLGVKVVSHRAGRWGLDECYAQVLEANGYRVDCSVTPHVSWKRHQGDPRGSGGADYSRFPSDAYFIDLDDISRPGSSALLEVPMTIVPARSRIAGVLRRLAPRASLARRALDRVLPPAYWLRPNGRNRKQLVRIVEGAVTGHLEFMLHSSELMPGGSPRFPRHVDLENLYGDLEVLFGAVRGRCAAATLSEYYSTVTGGMTHSSPAPVAQHGRV